MLFSFVKSKYLCTAFRPDRWLREESSGYVGLERRTTFNHYNQKWI
ncbi:hypothetical protein Premu_0135 [Hallella multisaccharivorax DSM 17128]|uniref:Uncharacterized protein n=1 Tax=Hallella multisaccharivorax DSM 17128 TaxID=688246 RepID=F8N8Y1_9BACT|nr:hypothetical protein Premu_0135 [Hallella multisaccharivorax DSM 17128]